MDLLGEAGEHIEDTLNADGRSAGHVALGVVVCLGAVALSALVAHRAEPGEFQRDVERQSDQKTNQLSQVWPALFSITTLAALRVWNAPASGSRTRALTLWGASQALNAGWMAASPRNRVLQTLGGIATAVLTAAYAAEARKVDVKAGSMATPMAGMAIGNLLTGEVWRRSRPHGVTVH
jgi:tryptophan-rich sensory protein